MAFWKSSLNPFICSGWTDYIPHTFPAAFIAAYCLSHRTRCNSEIILALLAVCCWISVSQFGLSLLKEGCGGGHIVDVHLKKQLDSVNGGTPMEATYIGQRPLKQ